jgi:MerR family transcriptional regulator, light-induced transcriptional regulator
MSEEAERPDGERAETTGSEGESKAGAGIYSIRVVSRLTGISLDTLRVWERRYGFPKPSRKESGSRLYTQLDVDTLLLASKALAAGYRPSEAVGKSFGELSRLLATSGHAPRVAPAPALAPERSKATVIKIDDFLSLVVRGDFDGFREELRRASLLLGPRGFMIDLVHPLAVRIGEEWEAGALEVHQEHMASAALVAQLRVLSSAFEGRSAGPTIIMTTLPGDLHSLGLDMAALALHMLGADPRSLGPNTPIDQIAKACIAHRANVVGLSVTFGPTVEETQRSLFALLGELPRDIEIWVGGEASRRLAVQAPRLHYVYTIDEMEARVAAVRAKLSPR